MTMLLLKEVILRIFGIVYKKDVKAKYYGSRSSLRDLFAEGKKICTRVKLAWQHLSSGKKAGKKHR